MNNLRGDIAPLVSVCPLTYNHAKYFSQAIESILSQQTDFDFEIIVGEDESSDGTRELALDFQRRFPDKIKILLHSRKDVIYVNGRPTGRWNFVDTISHARGKYIALLPCDDFWTDTNKLQKQVNVLETHPEYSVCGHWVVNVDANGNTLDSTNSLGRQCPEIFTERMALTGTPLHPNSWVFRRFDLAAHPQYRMFLKLPAGDDPLMLLLLGLGNGYCIKESMSAYRLHSGGTWSTKAPYQKDFEMLQFRLAALRLIGWRNIPQSLKIIYKSVFKLWSGSGQLAINTRSFVPINGLFKLFVLQETISVFGLMTLLFAGAVLVPASVAKQFGRKIINRLRAVKGDLL